MSREDSIVEERVVGNCTVKLYYDRDPQHPDEGSDDLFIVSFSNDFHIVRKGTWECHGDFRDFMHPKFKVDMPEDDEEHGDYEEPEEEPKDNKTDPLWRKRYCEACDNQIESLIHASGEDTDFDNPAGLSAASKDYSRRYDLWYEWQRYKKEHAEWACFILSVCYYGGGQTSLSLGDIYTGMEEDRWGQPEAPRGFVMVKKSAGWLQPLEEAAESLVEEWQSYCNGNVYGYVVTDDLEDEEVDSCWGFIGDQEHCMAEGVSAAEWHEKNGRKQVLLPFTEPREGANG